MTEALARRGGDVKALWVELRGSEFQISEWHGKAPSPLCRQAQAPRTMYRSRLAARSNGAPGRSSIRTSPPWRANDLLDPAWIKHGETTDEKIVAGPLCRLLGRAGNGIVHVRNFLTRCARIERDRREARRPEMKRRVWVGSDAPMDRRRFLNCSPTGSISCRARCASFRIGKNRAPARSASMTTGRSKSLRASRPAGDRIHHPAATACRTAFRRQLVRAHPHGSHRGDQP